MKQISVVVADSSPFVCRLLKNYLESAPDIRVIGAAHQGRQLVEMVEDARPDVVTLGLEMPDMSGLAALQATQQIRFTPAIIISGANMHAAAMTLEAMNHGAVDFVFKFTPGTTIDPDYLRREIINKVRVASHINSPVPEMMAMTEVSEMPAISNRAVDVGVGVAAVSNLPPEKIIVIGASTGGPVALQQLLCQFPADFSSSILVVQHLPATFTAVLAEQLQRQLPLRVKEAAAGDQLQRAAVLITPGGLNAQVNSNGQIELCEAIKRDDDLPSINLTMQSVATAFGAKARGVLLTGMGQDGVDGLTEIRQHGGITFAQSLETCTVKGMPQRAIEAGVVDHIAPPQQIAHLLLSGV
jgi:two-component system, chemotaxis family, protein-glutamate methylesterase/glutaminase